MQEEPYSDGPSLQDRARRLLAVIEEEFPEDSLYREEPGSGVEFFEPAADWMALVAYVQQLQGALERAREALDRATRRR